MKKIKPLVKVLLVALFVVATVLGPVLDSSPVGVQTVNAAPARCETRGTETPCPDARSLPGFSYKDDTCYTIPSSGNPSEVSCNDFEDDLRVNNPTPVTTGGTTGGPSASTSSPASDIETSRGDCEVDRANIIFQATLCWIVEALFNTISNLYSGIFIPLLQVRPLTTDLANASPDQKILFEIWSNFRVVANIMFVFIFLISIIGQSFSWFFTPYELKKIIPRLFFGVIAIQLSWYFVAFTVDVFNILGAGVRGLMLAPLGDVDRNFVLDFGGSGNGFSNGNLAATTLFLGAVSAQVIASTGTGILSGTMLILFPVVMGLLAAFVTLLLRQAIIYLLVVTAPLAFAAWILPNTQGVFKTWWSFFSKALLMYPLIVLLISGGEFLAGIITAESRANDGVSIHTSLISIIALFAPYFLVPATFRFAGGALAALSGNMDGLTKKLDRRIFGDERIPGTIRYKRKDRMEMRKGYRKERFIKRANNFGGKDSGTRRNRAGVAAAKASAMVGGNAFMRVAQKRAERYQDLKDLVSSGRDEVLFAIVSGNGYHPITGRKISQEAQDEANALFANSEYRDEGLVEAATFYTMTKGIPGNQLHKVKEALDNNPRLPKLWSQDDREQIWDRAVNRPEIVDKHPDQRFQNLATDAKEGVEYMNDLNGRRGAGTMSRVAESGWLGADRTLQHAEQIYRPAYAEASAYNMAQETAGSTDRRDYTHYLNNDNERQLIEGAKLFQEQTVKAMPRGPEASNEVARRMQTDHSWLDNVRTPGGTGGP